MKFRYIGNPHDRLDLHSEIVAFGLIFPLDQPVEVKDPRAIRKLQNNGHFEAVPDDESEVDAGEGEPDATTTPDAPPAALEAPPAAPEAPAPLPAPSPIPQAQRTRRRG